MTSANHHRRVPRSLAFGNLGNHHPTQTTLGTPSSTRIPRLGWDRNDQRKPLSPVPNGRAFKIYPLPNKSVRVRSCGSWVPIGTLAAPDHELPVRAIWSRSRWPVPSKARQNLYSDKVRRSTPGPQAQHRARFLEYWKLDPKSTKDAPIGLVDQAGKRSAPPTRRRRKLPAQSLRTCLYSVICFLKLSDLSLSHHRFRRIRICSSKTLNATSVQVSSAAFGVNSPRLQSGSRRPLSQRGALRVQQYQPS